MGAPTINTFFKRAGNAPCGEHIGGFKDTRQGPATALMASVTVQAQRLGFLFVSRFLPSRGRAYRLIRFHFSS